MAVSGGKKNLPYIKGLGLQDFLNHKDKRIKLDPGINVITGTNGSGKSAMVVAICAGLGLRIGKCGRGNSCTPKDFIRHGAESATVKLTIANEGPSRINKLAGIEITDPRNYRKGSEITIIRNISMNSSTYRIRVDDRPFRAEKETPAQVLHDLKRQLKFQPENPCVMLHQERVKELFTDGKHMQMALYKFFMNATNLHLLKKKLIETANSQKRMRKRLRELKKANKEANSEFQKQKFRVDQLIHISEADERINMMRESIHYQDLDKLTAKKKQERILYRQAQKRVDSLVDTNSNKEIRKNELIEDSRLAAERHKEVEDELKNLVDEQKEKQLEIQFKKREVKQAEKNLESQQTEINRVTTAIHAERFEVKQEERESSFETKDNHEQNIQDVQEELRELEEKRRKLSKRIADVGDSPFDDIEQENIQELEHQRRTVNADVQRMQYGLRGSQQSGSREQILCFKWREIQAKLQQAERQRQFSGMIIGPLGKFVQLKHPERDKDYEQVIQWCCKEVLNVREPAWLVTKADDCDRLQKILESCGHRGPKIFIQRETNRMHTPQPNPLGQKWRDRGVRRVYDVINFTFDWSKTPDGPGPNGRANKSKWGVLSAHNCILTQCSPEFNFLLPADGSMQIAYEIYKDVRAMNAGSIVKRLITPAIRNQAPRIWSDRSGRSITNEGINVSNMRRGLLVGDQDDSHTQEQLKQAKEELKQLDRQFRNFQIKTHAHRTELKRLKDERKKANRQMNDLRDELSEIKENAKLKETGPDLDELSKQREETVKREAAENREKLGDLEDSKERLVAKVLEKTKELQNLTAEDRALAREQGRLDREEEILREKQTLAARKIGKHDDAVRNLEHKLKKAQAKVDEARRSFEDAEYEEDQLKREFKRSIMRRGQDMIDVIRREPKVRRLYLRRRQAQLIADIEELRKLQEQEKNRTEPLEDRLEREEDRLKELRKNVIESNENLTEHQNGMRNTMTENDKLKHEYFSHRIKHCKKTNSSFKKIMRSGGHFDKNAKFSVIFNHEAQTVSVAVKVHIAGRRDMKVTEIHELSGGERSYCQLAFLLAISHSVDSPTIVYDEFDVFMDNKNRHKVVGMLKKRAWNSGLQYIFVTPKTVNVFEEVEEDISVSLKDLSGMPD